MKRLLDFRASELTRSTSSKSQLRHDFTCERYSEVVIESDYLFTKTIRNDPDMLSKTASLQMLHANSCWHRSPLSTLSTISRTSKCQPRCILHTARHYTLYSSVFLTNSIAFTQKILLYSHNLHPCTPTNLPCLNTSGETLRCSWTLLESLGGIKRSL